MYDVLHQDQCAGFFATGRTRHAPTSLLNDNDAQ